ncbi:U-box domain-containing protein 43 [Neltuma alba]|uniref:U-box domain-containing protein 43 n=1 Tax=Neltuma alba TaxID=207710 RepID=UPI0010A4F578|nr:U-box domain-containing protein 43-like [Prosopis alba]XP_028806638.1 U-box domain-containing protein 43-like [Prosopis alba]
MADDSIDHASLIPASELLFHTVLSISDVTRTANQILIQKDNFRKLSTYLEKVSLILKGLSKEDIHHAESLKNSLGVLNQEVKVARQLVSECNCKSKIYLLISCRKIAENLECCTKNISRAVSLIPLTSLDVSSGLSKQISELCQNMLDDEYRVTAAEEEILEKLELAIQEGNAERSHANQLLARIVDVIGISTEHAVIKREFKELKGDMQIAASRRDIAEALHMEQIVGLLEKADSVTSSQDKEKRYFEKRNSLGRQLLEPLHSFYCPISLDIMEDPVETSSGKTFERKAIEKWLAEGNNNCPLTMLPLDASKLRPNKTLRQSIQEWKDRNTIITLSALKSKLESDDEEEMLKSLEKLQGLCLERQMHREWVKMENYITTLIKLLGAKNREIRKRVLSILSLLAKDNEENKEDIAKVDNALESIVRSLARQIEESKLAVELLLELSRSTAVRDLIGDVQGSMLLLVRMLSSDDVEADHNASELLDNLSFLNQNVIEMAKANYLKPLLRNLSSGTENVKIIMAKTLSEIELTDQNKISIVRDGALQPLLQLLSNSDVKIKEIAVKALLQFSSLPENGLHMIREGVAQSLFELLYRHSLQSPTLREQAAATMMHLAMSTTHQRADEVQVSLLDSEDDVFKFFSLVSFTGPDIQSKILKTFMAMCQSPSGLTIRERLRQLSAVQVLVHLLELDNQTVRANAMKLFYYLTEGGDCRNFTSHVTARCINVLLTIIRTTDDAEEIVSAMGIISRLPKEPHINQWLLDSGAVKIILDCLLDQHKHASHKRQLIENSVQALCRFTVSTNVEWQKTIAQEGIIPILVQLLDSGTSLSKQHAAISIKQFSESSRLLSKPIKKPGIFKFCFVAYETGCPAHQGACTVESSFCMIEADALKPLVRMLEEQDIGTCEASLDALLTLIHGEAPPGGCKVLAEANAITPLLNLLSLQSARLVEKILVALEKIFLVDEIKIKYKALATMPLVEVTQRKDSRLRSLAARVLAQLGVLEKQSSYF